MKLQFIIVGWHFDNFPELVDQLIELNQNNDFISVFWSCHKDPSKKIKENFDYKLFPNLGLEDGAYQQALDYLEIDDDTILFLLHDDLVIKDWEFINLCLNYINLGYKVIGNGINYPLTLDPNEVKREKKYIDFVKEECKSMFSTPLFCYTIRESFMCIKRGDLRKVGDFEVIWEEPIPDKEGKFHIGGIGNLQQSLLGYKLTKAFGKEKFQYLSKEYQDSNYLFECARGKIN
tara:strand:- start:10132 stop:10830 length:699 start_codon:yes stop_codon:yes gene_type:complete